MSGLGSGPDIDHATGAKGKSLDDVLECLRQDYWEMVPVKQVREHHFKSLPSDSGGGDHGLWKLENQQLLLDRIVMEATKQQYPPHPTYMKNFLKAYIDFVEKHQEEVDEVLLEQYFEVGPLSDAAKDKPTPCFKSYRVGSHMTMNIRVFQEFNEVGLNTWEAGFYLSEWALSNQEMLKGTRCLEVGAGLGMTGIALAKVAPEVLWLTDYSETVLANLRSNIEIAGTGAPAVVVENLDLETIDGDGLAQFDADYIFAADVTYDKDLTKHLARCLRILLSNTTRPNPPTAYIAATLRNANTYNSFLEALTTEGLTADDVTASQTVEPLFRYPRSNVHLLRIRL